MGGWYLLRLPTRWFGSQKRREQHGATPDRRSFVVSPGPPVGFCLAVLDDFTLVASSDGRPFAFFYLHLSYKTRGIVRAQLEEEFEIVRVLCYGDRQGTFHGSPSLRLSTSSKHTVSAAVSPSSTCDELKQHQQHLAALTSCLSSPVQQQRIVPPLHSSLFFLFFFSS